MLSEFLLTEMGRVSANDELPLHRRLYEALRRAILDGHLRPEEKLPSNRDLAHDLKLSRNTVVTALNQLGAEGYLSSRVGSGTYVHEGLARAKPLPGAAQPAREVSLSRRGQALTDSFSAAQLEVQPFTPGPADFSAFPIGLWQRLQNKHWRMTYPEMLDYSTSGGHAPLRRAVANHLRLLRGVAVTADQVLITNGTQQSLELCAHLLADHGDTVWVEDPAYWGAVKAFMASGLSLRAIPVDGEGIAPTEADESQAPRLIYVTPSHQYPTGAIMSLVRRHRLLDIARTHRAWILEDDYDSDFRFSGPPISSLAGLDRDALVLYMGSFSKVLYPGLKLGYLVVPTSLAPKFRQAHYDLNRPGQMPLQAALAEFMEMGHFVRALRTARHRYAHQRDVLLRALQPCLGSATALNARIEGAEQGLSLCIRMAKYVDDAALTRYLAQRGLTVRPLSAYCLQRTDARGLVVGYGYAPVQSVARHAPELAAAITAFASGAPTQAIKRRP
jgi:GntR family transcriptional regulator / MocR family aminotransferase